MYRTKALGGPSGPPWKAGAGLRAPTAAAVTPAAGAVEASTTRQALVTVCVTAAQVVHCRKADTAVLLCGQTLELGSFAF